jgi:tetratricopeptide (TPR) repeat protein
MEGKRLGTFEIVRELGAGAMGTVYEAHDAGGRRVALKVVHPHLVGRKGFRERFQREAAVGRQIDHPNVIRTYDAGEIEGQPYISLEFVQGQTLDDLRAEMGRVPETLCRHIGLLAARGLSAIHDAGIVHRDVKPENVLITPEHEVRLMDLGLARTAAGLDRMTRTGQFVGSPAYAPPEQFVGTGALDARSDLYSLGVTLYELATGERPFMAESLEALAGKVIKEVPPRPTRSGAEISPFFEALLLALLAKEPDRRVGTAHVVGDVLEAGEDSDWWSLEATRIESAGRLPLRRPRLPRETPCVGREAELAVLREAFESTRAGEGRVVLLEGEAGIGKTRIVDELIRLLDEDDADVHVLHGAYPPGGAATATGAFVEAYGTQLGGESAGRYLTDAPALAPAFDALMRGDVAAEGAQPLTPDALKTGFVQVTRGLAKARTTIVAIDDLQFAPDAGRALFASLAMGLPGHRVLLVGTARPGLPREWLAELELRNHVTRVEVGRLPIDDVQRLLAPIVGDTLDAERLAERIGATADGNPFFLFEIVRSLRESGVLSQAADGTWATVSRVRDLALPDTVQGLLDARIARLTDEERELLECAACRGVRFDGRLIAEAVGLRSLPVLRMLARVEKEHGLVRAVGGHFRFGYHAVQEHLVGALPGAVREELHAALAEALESRSGAADRDVAELDGELCIDLCDHFLRGGRGPGAVRYLRPALEHAARGYRHETLVGLAEMALARDGLVEGESRFETLLLLSGSLDLTGGRERQESAVREALAIADDVGEAAAQQRGASSLAQVLWRTSQFEEAESCARRALELARAAGDRVVEGHALNRLATILKSAGDNDAAQEHYEQLLATGVDADDAGAEAHARGGLGNIAFARGELMEAHLQYGRALELWETLGDDSGQAAAHGNLGNVLYQLSRFEEAREHAQRQLAITQRLGDRAGESRATGALAIILKAQSAFIEATSYLRRSGELSREIGYLRGEAVSLVNLGATLLELGDIDGARSVLEESLAVARSIGAHYPEGYGLKSLANVADEQGDVERALELTREALALRRRIRHGDGVAGSLIDLGDRLRRTGDHDGARAALDEAIALCREQGREAQVALAISIREALPGGDVDVARKAFAPIVEHGGDSVQIRYLHWLAGGDTADLESAKAYLDEVLSHVEEPHRSRIRTRIRLHREVMDAWSAEFEGDDESEAATRVG